MSWILGTNFLAGLGQSAQKRDAKTSLENTACEQSKKPQRLWKCETKLRNMRGS